MHSGKAFTLAEVLITLGIIGIVAAMTLPAAINKTKNKELEVAFKKSYSLLNQVTQRVIIEDFGGVVDANSSYIIAKNFLKYYKNAELCSTKSGNGVQILPIKLCVHLWKKIIKHTMEIAKLSV